MDAHNEPADSETQLDEANPPTRICTIRCPLVHVLPFAAAATASLLSASQAARLVWDLIEHVCAQLQLTPASWSDLEEMRVQLEAHRAAGHSVSSKCRPFLVMMRDMHAVQRAVQRAFVAPPGCNHYYPRVQQVLLMFGSSLHNPLLIFRLHIAYEQRDSPADDARQTAALSRSMVRQLMQHSALLFPTHLPVGLHSRNMRLHTLFQFDRHADAALSIPVPLAAAASAEDSVVEEETSIAPMDFSEYAGLQFKPDYSPKLLSSYSFAAPPSPRSADADTAMTPDADLASSSASAAPAPRVRRVKPFRIPKPKAPLPFTILLGTAEQTVRMAARYHNDAAESGEFAGVWYQCVSSASFSRRVPPMPDPPQLAEE